MSDRVLNVGIIGGGGDAFIVHPQQRAILMDGSRKVSVAALSSNKEKALSSAREWPFPIQGYESYDAMLKAELEKPPKERIDYVLIVTPNHAHYDPAKKFLQNNIPVFCEKPLSLTLEESQDLCKIVEDKNIPFCVAHTYLGHWSSRLARHIVRSGLLGEVRWVDSSYLQGWLADKLEDRHVTQALWRTDPAKAGVSGCGGDIGTHALMQLRFVTGLEIKRLSAFLHTFVPERRLDDHFTVYCELSNRAKALVRSSQIAIGHKNDLRIEINADKGTLIWQQEEAERLNVLLAGQPERVYWRGEVQADDGFLKNIPEDLMRESTLPSGHVEGLHDAFATLHRCFEADVRAFQAGRYKKADGSKYATVEDGLITMKFLTAATQSNAQGNQWIDF